jgi:hypothetical protein
MAKRTPEQPRISVNKLAEFMTAKAARQRQILRDQKYPTDFKGMYYKEAGEAIAQSVASNLENFDSIDRAIRILEQTTTTKIGTQRRLDFNIDALETFRSMVDSVDLKGSTPSLAPTTAPRLTIQNVEISVRPEIILRAEGRTGPLVGAVKLHFPRTFSISEDSSGYLSAVLQEWCKTHMADDGAVSGPHCFVIDIGASKQCLGVKSTAARMREVAAVCQNIAALWPAITPSAE